MNKILLKRLMLLAMMGAILSYTGCKKDEEPVNPADLVPAITTVSPAEGNIGTKLTITGVDFAAGATVMVGSQAATGVEVVSSTAVTALVPDGVPFNTLLSVSVRNSGGGEAVAEDAFKALAGTPVIADVSPKEGMIGSELTITGTDFDPEATVLIEGIEATAVSVSSPNSITATAPEGITINTLLPVTVRNPDGEEGTLVDAFMAIHPVVESITPSEGSVGTEINILGANFEDGVVVWIGGIEATTIDVVSSSSIYVIVPEGIEGNTPLTVRVQKQNGADGMLEDAFTAIDPVLSYVNSATKPSGNIGSTIILEGKAYGDLQGSGKVLFSDGNGGTIEAEILGEEDWTETFIVTTVPNGTMDGPILIQTAIGTSNSLEFKVTSNAAFSPSDIGWTLTTPLPEAVSGHQAMYVPVDNNTGEAGQFVYVSGGKNSNPETLSQVVYGQINADATISTWNTATALPEPRAFHASIAATPYNSKVEGAGYLYVLGGTSADGEATSTVHLAPFNSDGSLSNWGTTTILPQPLHSMGAAIFRNTIYISGGATSGNEPVKKVYRSVIEESGELGAWQELASLPSARAHHSFVSFGAYLYAIGGESGTVAPDQGTSTTNLDEVLYAKIDLRTGKLAQESWTLSANSLQKGRSKHTALAVGGNLFVSSGLYSGAAQGSSENIYAQIFSDGEIDTFNGATGSKTLLNEGGSSLFNQSGISYIDADGVGHVLILGGDDVKTPGSKKANVLFY